MANRNDPETLYDTIATIFAVSVLLNETKHDRELIEFSHACCSHNRMIRPQKINPRETIVEWFHAHAPEIRNKLKDPLCEVYKIGLLRQVGEPTLHLTILSSIFAICIADGTTCSAEDDFIKTAEAVWGITVPTSDELEAVI